MPSPAITCPHRRIISPHPAAAARRDPLAARAPGTTDLRASKRRRSPPSLSLSRAARRPPCWSAPPATTRRVRAAVAVGGDGDGGGSSAALLAGAQSTHAVFRDDLVLRAFSVAEAAHRGQVRASGGPYLQHCIETAALLAELGAGSAVVAAGLLHDTVDDAGVEYGFISEQFDAGVADLVKGVSNLSHLSRLARRNNTASRTDEVDRLRTVFLATVDARAVLIKLADRLHNMRTLDSLPKIKQQRFAKETLKIFAPLANQLGILNWKEQIENLCFKYLYPDEYAELSANLMEFYNRDMIAAATRRLEQALEVRGLSFYTVYGRHKSRYSIYSKMRRYQSLHTVVLTEETLPLEIQIRTRDMHLQAEFGIAAHWRYKEGLQNYFCSVPETVEWVTWVATWQRETLHIDHPSSLAPDTSGSDIHAIPSHSDAYLFSYSKQQDRKGPVLVILLENEKMSVQELPQNSTILDLLRRSCCNDVQLRLRLNYNVTHNWNQELKMGDVVELIPSTPCKSGGYERDFHQMFNHYLAISQS
ncbi:hypothetical protein PR202_ga29213 [Eleusine coracana subsp. coracana]|uniref:GTP diphosphokinase n=1 Tax=Eleusine coracana subsp. coracana TaxID=191504 RepID=A0AAV5DLS4_ELECO|nr:hypothetical protein PR202_ga29213 [Eleusine coracana subsp. coracana]